MFYVYIIRPLLNTTQIYTGFTSNIEQRLIEHNQGGTTHTSKFKLWELVTYLIFDNKFKALKFEEYLKSGSGRAFIKRRLL